MATVLEKVSEFRNEPVKTFADAASRDAMSAAIEAERKKAGTEYDLIIDGKKVKGAKKFASRNPARPSEVIGVVQSATPDQARAAVEAADRAFRRWSKTP